MKRLSVLLFALALAVPTVLWVGTAIAATPKQKCQQAKCKAQGKLKRCLMNNAAKVLAGKEDKSAACWTKYQTKLAKVDAKAANSGTKCRFLDNANGTVTDLDTGLMWEKKQHRDDVEVPGDPHDADNAYTMSTDTQGTPDGTVYTDFLQTLNNAASLNGQTTTGCFAGHCDWRLPLVEELKGLLDETEGYCGGGGIEQPCVDPDLGPTNHHHYRSATTVLHEPAQPPSQVWDVHFVYLGFTHGDKTSNCHVRAVRAGL